MSLAQKVELLAPAGSPEALDAAVACGADAVYLGLKSFNARMRSSNFAYSQFEGALKTLRRAGKKIYVTVNTVFEEREADRLYQLLKYLDSLGPDGLLVQDFGVVAMAKDNFPARKLHASTQMNIASSRGVNLLSRYGFSRAVLARELSLEEIKTIRANTNMELEIFIHGALCVSVSGLCLFSSFLGGKSANRGMCTQACRRLYRRDGESGAPAAGGGDEGYYFSPLDLELIGRVPELAEAGVNSFKIEGRMKSAEYVGAVVSAYRLVIDSLGAGEKAEGEALSRARALLRNDFARGKTAFLLDGLPEEGGKDRPSWLNPAQSGGTGIPLGKIIKTRGEGEEKRALIRPDMVSLEAGDSIRLHRADDSGRDSHKIRFADPDSASGGLWVSIPDSYGEGDAVYLIQTKSMSRRYPPVIPKDLDGFRKSPGRDRAPPPRASSSGAKKTAGKNAEKSAAFPEGLYAFVQRIEDLYVLQSSRPVRVMLPLRKRLARRLIDTKLLPFTPGETVLVLDPFFPEGAAAETEELVKGLLEKGYRSFMLNNPGHFSLFRGLSGAQIAAGPYLYAFNEWAAAFLAENGADSFVSPLENNRQNLEKTVPENRRGRVFVTVYAIPALFRIRADLSAYGFGAFSGGRGEEFSLESGEDGSFVYPENAFSITDKLPFLKEAGFRRFILDFSAYPLKKADYRTIMTAVKTGAPLPGASRFNWKDGFFRPDA